VVTELDVGHGVVVADLEPAALGFADGGDLAFGADGLVGVATGGLEEGREGDELDFLGDSLAVGFLLGGLGGGLSGGLGSLGGLAGRVRSCRGGFAAREGREGEEMGEGAQGGNQLRVYRCKRCSSKGSGRTSVAAP
jgi:hypothetical protein